MVFFELDVHLGLDDALHLGQVDGHDLDVAFGQGLLRVFVFVDATLVEQAQEKLSNARILDFRQAKFSAEFSRIVKARGLKIHFSGAANRFVAVEDG
jgi:hypothetical protein